METAISKESSCCRKFKSRASAVGIALLSLLLLCFAPERPFGLATTSPAEELSKNSADRIHETFRIYGVIKSNAPQLDAEFAWRLAAVVRVESQSHALDPMLVLAVIKTESRFENGAVSVSGARGMMQILPFVGAAVAQEKGIKRWAGKKSLHDPVVNIKLGVFYLKSLKEKFRDLHLTLAAYRWGPVEIANRINSEAPVPLEYSQKVLDHYRLFRAAPPVIPKVIPKLINQEGARPNT
jgi:soluble lytic murein transglycosylase-like protein